MGFADTGASRLRNNRKLLGSRRRMNDAHLKVGKYYKEKPPLEKATEKNKTPKDKPGKFKLNFVNKRKLENRKSTISIISLIVLAILVGFLLFTFIK